MMEHGDKSQLAVDANPPVRKPWNAPILNQVEVAGNTYGPNNANTNDPDYFSNPS